MYCPKCGKEIPGEGMCECNKYMAAPEQINSYLVQAIIVTVLCCVPFGIVSIVYAAKVSSLVAAGNIAEARKASDTAKMWAWLGFGIGLFIQVIATIIQSALFFVRPDAY